MKYYVLWKEKGLYVGVAHEHYYDAVRECEMLDREIQPRVVKLVNWRCPQTGEWMKGHAEEEVKA